MNLLTHTPRVSPSTFAKGMRALMVGFNLLIVGLAIWEVRQSRHGHVQHAETTTQNLAQVLEQNVNGTLRQIDLTLLSIRDQSARSPGGLRNPGLLSLMETQFVHLGMVDALWVTDPEGRFLQGTPSGDPAPVGPRKAFRALPQDGPTGLVISPPARDGQGGAWAITLARRIDGPQGALAGVVCATLPLERLAQAMSKVDVGRHGTVSLRGENLALLSRHPHFQGLEQMIGDPRIGGDYLAAVQASAPMVHFTASSTLDGQRRTYTLRRIDHPRLHILVGLAESEYLQPWRRHAAITLAAAAALVTLTLAMGWLARSAWLRQLADQDRLAAEEAKYRLLAENATDVIWSMDPEGLITYISPSLTRQRGWTPEEFLALSPENRALSKETAKAVQERMTAARLLPPGTQPFEGDLLEATVTHKDGRELQVEAQWRIVWGEDGRLMGFQGVTRDVTERKRLEADRENLIRDLTQALTEVKQLSGMLPICGQCKKVRDDRGYWNQIEAYLSQHTEATFTHGVCPECAATFRQEMQVRRDQKGGDGGQG